MLVDRDLRRSNKTKAAAVADWRNIILFGKLDNYLHLKISAIAA